MVHAVYMYRHCMHAKTSCFCIGRQKGEEGYQKEKGHSQSWNRQHQRGEGIPQGQKGGYDCLSEPR